MSFPKDQDLLKNLKNILAISSELLDNFSDENVISILQKRDSLLDLMEKKVLNRADSENKFDNETKMIVNRIISVDDSIKSKIKERMNQLKNEINGLYTTSRAAVAYSAYKGNKTRTMINTNSSI
jgi:hypothetical protein